MRQSLKYAFDDTADEANWIKLEFWVPGANETISWRPT
jgi:hypothetical protein